MVRIPVRDREDETNLEAETTDSFGHVNSEVAGPGGENMTGGDITEPQDAKKENDTSVKNRVEEEEMEEAQGAGEVEQQRTDAHPHANNPDGEDAAEKKSLNNGEQGLEAELEESHKKYLYLVAERENLKRQANRREQEARERSVRLVMEDLLPVVDNFERALESGDQTDAKNLRIGVEFILQQLQEVMRTHGVEAISSDSDTFDPQRHEAIEEVPDANADDGAIVEEVQRGYMLQGKVLRPSRVKVAGPAGN